MEIARLCRDTDATGPSKGRSSAEVFLRLDAGSVHGFQRCNTSQTTRSSSVKISNFGEFALIRLQNINSELSQPDAASELSNPEGAIKHCPA